MIKVLITEDSPVVRGFLEYVLNREPGIEVIGTARNGEEAVQMVSKNKPDVITMDIHMPRMDGFEATRKIMETNPVPIVICSASWNPEEVDKTFRTMEAGAVAALEKPRGIGHPDSEASVRELISTVKAMSEVKVVRRWARLRNYVKDTAVTAKEVLESSDAEIKLVAIGASTGGPMVLQSILSGLPKTFPVPVLIVQHIAMGFLSGLVDWLTKTTHFPVHIAKDGERLEPGKAYLSPDDYHLGIVKKDRVLLSHDKPENNLRPAVSFLFRSVADVCGNQALGVLLTGMGKDGAKELKVLKDRGGITIVQDRESSIVHGMPGEAIKLGAASIVLPSKEIAEKINQLVMSDIKKDTKQSMKLTK
jgi:two-component system chemotaxis response regulator CheB